MKIKFNKNKTDFLFLRVFDESEDKLNPYHCSWFNLLLSFSIILTALSLILCVFLVDQSTNTTLLPKIIMIMSGISFIEFTYNFLNGVKMTALNSLISSIFFLIFSLTIR